jgi:hypothetical protein
LRLLCFEATSQIGWPRGCLIFALNKARQEAYPQRFATEEQRGSDQKRCRPKGKSSLEGLAGLLAPYRCGMVIRHRLLLRGQLLFMRCSTPSHPPHPSFSKDLKEGMFMAEAAQEEAYWREQHAKQAYAEKDRPFEHYAPAYRLGYEAALEHRGKTFEEVEDDIALNYERGRPEEAVPWDYARPAVKAAWDRLGGVVGPRDFDRGIRTGI